MKRLWSKLSACRGETLTETLCALLVVALASAALATMLSVANRLNASAIARDDALYADLTAAEGRASAAGGGNICIKLPGEEHPQNFPVTWYGGEGLWSYALAEQEEEGGGAP